VIFFTDIRLRIFTLTHYNNYLPWQRPWPKSAAYHVALLKGTDVDKPRNLAKLVTVE